MNRTETLCDNCGQTCEDGRLTRKVKGRKRIFYIGLEIMGAKWHKYFSQYDMGGQEEADLCEDCLGDFMRKIFGESEMTYAEAVRKAKKLYGKTAKALFTNGYHTVAWNKGMGSGYSWKQAFREADQLHPRLPRYK